MTMQRNQEGTEGGGSVTIQREKGRGHRNEEGTESGGSVTIQRERAEAIGSMMVQRVEDR